MITVLIVALAGLYCWHLAGNETFPDSRIAVNANLCYLSALFFLICVFFGEKDNMMIQLSSIFSALFWYLLYLENSDCLVQRIKKKEKQKKEVDSRASEEKGGK